MTKINSLDDLRPGDIMISGMSTAPTKLLVYLGQLILGEMFRIGKFAAGHAAVVVPGGYLVEAMPSGARVRMIQQSDWSYKNAYLRLPEDYPGQARDAASMALAMLGTPYSFASYVYLAAYRFGFRSEWLLRRINRRKAMYIDSASYPTFPSKVEIPVEAICSVLAEQAWTLTGKEVIRGTKPQVVTPGMLAQQLWTRNGVIRGGAGLVE